MTLVASAFAPAGTADVLDIPPRLFKLELPPDCDPSTDDCYRLERYVSDWLRGRRPVLILPPGFKLTTL